MGSSWSDLQAQFTVPDWFADARFGVWLHWGAQSQPLLGGGWYARHCYMPDVGDQEWGKNAYRYHQQTYGHQSEAGFKDVIHSWKAERLDPDRLAEYFAGIGAKYFVAMANHHDHFDNFASTHHQWNSVAVGPRRDLIGEFAAASRRVGLPFGVSSHDDRMVMYYEHAFGSDTDGPHAGVPYDGRLTAADGAGTWWEGLDPAELYGPPPEQRTAEWVARMQQQWQLRHVELVEKYRPDLLWFDGWGFPYGDHGVEVCRVLYDQSIAEHGRIENVVVGKIPDDPAVVDDVEKGVSLTIRPQVWQGTTTFTDWFYKEDGDCQHNGRTLIEVLTDVISKNGNLLLSVELFGDGTIPPEHRAHLDELGAWVRRHHEAIFGSRPWHIHGDNLSADRGAGSVDAADLDQAATTADAAQFNQRTVATPAYPHDEVRFTTRAGVLYVFVMNPVAGPIRLPGVGTGAVHDVGTARSVQLLGSTDPVTWHQDADALELTVPERRPGPHVAVFAVQGVV